jgi:tetratricopeptide (TPR) repeat protein
MVRKMKLQGYQQFRIKFLFISLLFLGFISCNVLRPVVVEVDPEQAASEAYMAGDFETALAEYEALIAAQRERQEEVNGHYFKCAGLAAFELDETTRALDHLERAQHTDAVDDLTYAALAKAYRRIDNLSREITHLENYLNNYPDGTEAPAFRLRYFETLVESRQWDEAYALWPQLDEPSRESETLINQFYQVNLALGHEEAADALAEQLIALNPDNYDALDRLARRYYDRADARHQKEMAAYDRNRTQRQYAQLLEAFDVLNQDFRKSLTYFLKLYDINPTREYASYLRNIYTRFQDDERARYYRQQMGE